MPNKQHPAIGLKMYLFGTMINSVGFLWQHPADTLTQGFTPLTWFIIASQAANGLLYAAILKVSPPNRALLTTSDSHDRKQAT